LAATIPLLALVINKRDDGKPIFTLYTDLPLHSADSRETVDFFVGDTIAFNSILSANNSDKKKIYIRPDGRGLFSVDFLFKGSEFGEPVRTNGSSSNLYETYNIKYAKREKIVMEKGSSVFPYRNGPGGSVYKSCSFTLEQSGLYRLEITANFKYNNKIIWLTLPAIFVRVYENKSALAYEGLSLLYDVDGNDINNVRISNSTDEDIKAVIVNPYGVAFGVAVFNNYGITAAMGIQSRAIVNNYISLGGYDDKPKTILPAKGDYIAALSLSPDNYYYGTMLTNEPQAKVRLWTDVIIDNRYYRIFSDDCLYTAQKN